MHEGRTVFAPVMDWLPKYDFAKCVEHYKGAFHIGSMRCCEQFLVMAFAQLTCRESLCDIQTCLRALGPRLYHCGIRIGIKLREAAYALDSANIDLCLSLFPWAKFRRAKAAPKLHGLLAHRGSFPTVIILTRVQKNFRFRRRYSHAVAKHSGVRFDQTVILTGFYSHQQYPDALRRIGYRDPLTGKSFVFLTNNSRVSALTIARAPLLKVFAEHSPLPEPTDMQNQQYIPGFLTGQ